MMGKVKRNVMALLTALAVTGAGTAQVYAADNEIVAKYAKGRYSLDVQSDTLFDIPNLEIGEKYTKTMKIRNDGIWSLTVSMVDVKNNLSDALIYDNSNLDITIDGITVYSGSMNDARWSKVLSGKKSMNVEYTYYVEDKEHTPDNKWMHRDMDATYVFVGEWVRPYSGNGGSPLSTGSIDSSYSAGADESSSASSESQADETADSGDGSDADITVVIPSRNPQTGDSSHMAVYGVIFGLCGAGLVACIVVDEKNRKNK